MKAQSYAQSNRLELRDFSLDDVDALYAIYGEPETTRFLSFPPLTKPEVTDIITGIIQRRTKRPRTEWALAVELRDTKAMVGMLRLGVDTSNQAQMGFAINRQYWGQGLGTEAARLGLDFAFETLGVETVWGARDERNEASRKTLANVAMLTENETVAVTVRHADGTSHERISPVARITAAQWRGLTDL